MSKLEELEMDLLDKAEHAKYRGHFLDPKGQAHYFQNAAEVIDEHLETLHDECISHEGHDKELEELETKLEKRLDVLTNAHQYAYNELVILVEDLADKKLEFTRPSLQTRLNALLKKMKANIG